LTYFEFWVAPSSWKVRTEIKSGFYFNGSIKIRARWVWKPKPCKIVLLVALTSNEASQRFTIRAQTECFTQPIKGMKKKMSDFKFQGVAG